MRGPLEIKWVHNKCGQLSIGGVAWGAVEVVGEAPRQAALRRMGVVVTDAPGDKRRRRGKVIALDPHAGAVILDPRDPMQAARALVAARFRNGGHQLLHRHPGNFLAIPGKSLRARRPGGGPRRGVEIPRARAAARLQR